MTESQLFSCSSSSNKNQSNPTPVQIRARQVLEAIKEKKGSDLVIMDMKEFTGLADYFILCSGTSDIQVKAISESVEKCLKDEFQEIPWHVEGADHRQWVLLDYIDIVVHVFAPDRRSFYELERLWSDAPIEKVGEGVVTMLGS